MVAFAEPLSRSNSRTFAQSHRRPRPRIGKYPYPRLSPARLGSRFYNPGIGKWISRDPAREEGFGVVFLMSAGLMYGVPGNNTYAFSLNDPANRIDSLGLQSDSGINTVSCAILQLEQVTRYGERAGTYIIEDGVAQGETTRQLCLEVFGNCPATGGIEQSGVLSRTLEGWENITGTDWTSRGRCRQKFKCRQKCKAACEPCTWVETVNLEEPYVYGTLSGNVNAFGTVTGFACDLNSDEEDQMQEACEAAANARVDACSYSTWNWPE